MENINVKVTDLDAPTDEDKIDSLAETFGCVLLTESFFEAMAEYDVDFEFMQSNCDGTVYFLANGERYKFVISKIGE